MHVPTLLAPPEVLLAFCLVAPRDAAEPRDDWENHDDEDSDEESDLL